MKLVGINGNELVVLNSNTVQEAIKELPKDYNLYEEIATNYYIKVV